MLHAFSSLGCPELSLSEMNDLARAHGVEAIELRALQGSINLLSVLEQIYGSPERLGASLDGIPVISLGSSVRALEPREGDRDVLAEYGRWGEGVGARSIRVFDGGERLGSGELEAVHALLDWWGEESARRGWKIELLIETHDALAQPDVLDRFLDRVPEARILWDSHHTWRKGEESPAVTWRRLNGRVPHIHVKDSLACEGRPLPYRYVVPGLGEFPMNELRDSLAQSGYSGILSLEWERWWHRDLPPLQQALAGAFQGWW